jgi:hypothetical protein
VSTACFVSTSRKALIQGPMPDLSRPAVGGVRTRLSPREDLRRQRDGVPVGGSCHWAYGNRVQLDPSQPEKPVANPLAEAFNASLG